ncbi:PTS transporter subunit EIIC [Salipaludibacillus sp. LMS25]|uniref:PTS sugar transporter subunit IIC n=1 Tax=Salipaludibacillus sp. LMS25 TaxID=2924031 RepID=UPI0020D12AA5|nr:PTS transporter subunit EIIC [Salipaludibacillus sp. LMS25]UTR15936.1 PTS transporter subunit EIIC [Salipaludibacillus sp. LMS25]
MSKGKTSFLEKVSLFSERVGKNVYLQGISQGVMTALPFIIIGAFASLLVGLPIEVWQNFLTSMGINESLGMVVRATTNFLGVIITFFVANSFAEKLEVKSKIVGFLAVMFYLTLLPSYVMEDGTAFLDYDYLGTKGMLIGILLALFTVKLFKAIVSRNIVIKMPEGTPTFVSSSFAALIPGLVITFIALIVRVIFSKTPFGDAFSFIYGILQIPIQELVISNIWAVAGMGILVSLVFSLGIHPGFLQAIMAPFLFSLDGMNQAAYAAGEELPNIIGMAFSYITSTAIFFPAFAISVLIYSRSKQLKTVGKVSLAPAFFGISEPLVFGVPVVFNPLMIIPWALIPAINQIIAYHVISWGLVSRPVGTTVFNIPMIFTGILNGSISLVILEVALLLLDILLFMPFLKLHDRKILAGEMAATE